MMVLKTVIWHLAVDPTEDVIRAIAEVERRVNTVNAEIMWLKSVPNPNETP